MAVQNAFNVNPEVGYLGQCSRPGSPKATEAGVLSVPAAATRIPRPGDALFWHATSDAWRIPTSAAQSLLVTALLTYRVDTVQGADSILQFVDGAEIEVATMGFYFVQAGTAIEPQSNVHWDRSDYKYNTFARQTAVADLLPVPFTYHGRTAAADEDIIEISLGFGRII